MGYEEILYKSLNKWLKKIEYIKEKDYPEHYNEEIKQGIHENGNLEATLKTYTTNIILKHVQRDYLELLERLFKVCESEIEKIMLCALIVVGSEKVSNVYFLIKGIEFNRDENAGDRIIIEPQAVIGKYRIDFRIKFQEYIPDFDNKIEFNGEKIPGTKIDEEELLIECDGHDFHEKTKEQAIKDKRKDRMLQSLGFKIFRFTGSEIFQDPLDCANETINEFFHDSE